MSARFCCRCGKPIDHMRKHAKVCSSACRSSLFRSSNDTGLVIRINNLTYANMAISAFQCGKTVQALAVENLQRTYQ